MQDQFRRKINYLRISITDRCNLRCKYCMPAEGVPPMPHQGILSFEEILRLMRISIPLGFHHFRITGGEPLVRRDILDFLREGARISGVEDIMLTTNGILLPKMAFDLKAAGVRRVNVSLDTLNPERFFDITRGGDVSNVLEGIFSSLKAGLDPVKINVVVIRSLNIDELTDFLTLARNYPLHVRFIELMPIGISAKNQTDFVSITEIKERLGIKDYNPIYNIAGSGPAEYYRPKGFAGSIGFISALSRCFCAACNRVRLTADGKLRACLHNPQEVDLREALRDGSSDQKIAELLAQAVWEKPARHHMDDKSWNDKRLMSQIGG